MCFVPDVEEGGETAFPKNSVYTEPSIPVKGGPWSDCAKGHVAAKPKKNDAVLFYSYFPVSVDSPSGIFVLRADYIRLTCVQFLTFRFMIQYMVCALMVD
jgi:hypothetical protein